MSNFKENFKMNQYKKAMAEQQLEHSAKGQSWGKHKYIAIKNGRYIYPEDLQKGGTGGSSRPVGRQKNSIGSMTVKKSQNPISQTTRGGSTPSSSSTAQRPQLKLFTPRVTDRAKLQEDQIRSAHQGSVGTGSNNGQTTSKASSLQKQVEATKKRKEDAAKAAEEAKKKEETAATTTTSTTSTTEEKKSSGSGKKGSSGSKKSSSKKDDTTKTEDKKTTDTASTTATSEEAKALGLSDADMKMLESNIDTSSTERDTVIKNLALRVIRGDFGNGADRKTKLGKYYAEIQKKVNELMKEIKQSKAATTKTSTEVKHSDISSFDILRQIGVMGVKAGKKVELEHSGVKFRSGRYKYGSGDRPHQHDGGGGSRSVSDMSDDELKKSVARMGLEKQYKKMTKGSNKIEKSKDVVDAASNAVNRANNRNRERLNRRPQKERMDLSKMSDKELRDAINRENLEIQYSNLFGEEKNTVSKGEREVMKIMDYAGDALAVTSSALAIALAIKGLKG